MPNRMLGVVPLTAQRNPTLIVMVTREIPKWRFHSSCPVVEVVTKTHKRKQPVPRKREGCSHTQVAVPRTRHSLPHTSVAMYYDAGVDHPRKMGSGRGFLIAY